LLANCQILRTTCEAAMKSPIEKPKGTAILRDVKSPTGGARTIAWRKRVCFVSWWDSWWTYSECFARYPMRICAASYRMLCMQRSQGLCTSLHDRWSSIGLHRPISRMAPPAPPSIEGAHPGNMHASIAQTESNIFSGMNFRASFRRDCWWKSVCWRVRVIYS
jgi:hypothetical protein